MIHTINKTAAEEKLIWRRKHRHGPNWNRKNFKNKGVAWNVERKKLRKVIVVNNGIVMLKKWRDKNGDDKKKKRTIVVNNGKDEDLPCPQNGG